MDSGLDSESALLEGDKWGFCPSSSGAASLGASASKQCSTRVPKANAHITQATTDVAQASTKYLKINMCFIAVGAHREQHTTIAVSSQHQPCACSIAHAAQ